MALKWVAPSTLTLWSTGSTAALNDNTVSPASAEFNNASSLDLHGWIEFTGTWAVAPSDVLPTLDFYNILAPDGTNYNDAIAATLAPQQEHLRIANFGVRKVTSAQRIVTNVFPLNPFKTKFYMDNQTGQQLGSGWGGILYYGTLASS